MTTPIGAEGLNVESGIIRVASDAKNFAHMMLQMYSDEHMWNELPIKCRNFIDEKFTFSKAEAIFKQDIDNTYALNEENI